MEMVCSCKYVTYLTKLIILGYVMSYYIGLVAGQTGIGQLNLG